MENENMKTTLSPEVLFAIKAIIESEMDRKDSFEIPNSNGLVLVKIGTDDYEKRENDATVMFFDYDSKYCVSSK